MIKTLVLSVTVLAGTATLVSAQTAERMEHPMHHHRMLHHHSRHNKVTADGHCNGTSYGTGQLSCGTATGGTPGGNPSRN